MSQRIHSNNSYLTMLALIVVACCGYALPWIVAPAASMTLNGHDLAEWASLVPSQRATSPPLLTSLLLRLQLVMLSLLLGVIAVGRRRMAMSAVAICLLAGAQLPPFEFLYDINNLNYRQQFSLAALSLIAGLCLILLRSRILSLMVVLSIAAAGLVTSFLGLSMALKLYLAFSLDAAPGLGIWVLGLSYVALIANALREILTLRLTRS